MKDKLFTVMLVMALPFATSFAVAQTPTPAKYLQISPAQPVSSPDKVEVIEVFSYGCIHCQQFQPYVDAWLKHVDPKKVEFIYLPATFRADFAALARGFYAADSLGVAKSTHQRVFDAIFNNNMSVQTADDVVNLYEKLGVNRDAFKKAMQSFFVETQVRHADDMMRAYRIDGTPTLVVAGKYRITGESAGGTDKMFTVVDELVAQEQAAKH